MFRKYIYKSILIVLLTFQFGLSVQAQYYHAKKISNELKLVVNNENQASQNGVDMFSACPVGISVFGQVFRGTQSVDHGVVYLYSYDTIQKKYSLFGITPIKKLTSSDISYYYFDTVPMGEYTTLAVLSQTMPYSDQYAPAYLGNTPYWDQADRFVLSAPGYNYAINLCDIEYAQGSSSISGAVLEGSVKSPGDPVAFVPLYLIDDMGIIRGYTMSNTYGKYSFSNLAYGTYYVYSDLINYQITPSIVTTSTDNSQRDSINIYVGNGVVTSYENILSNDIDVRVFPNPTTDILNIEFRLEQERILKISVFNIYGQEVKSQSINKYFGLGFHTQKFDLSSLSKGVYNILIEDANGLHKVLKVVKY